MIRRLVLLIAAASLLAGLAAAPVSADPPDRGEFPLFVTFGDGDNRVAAFWNIERDEFCAWAAGGFMGDPDVFEDVPFMIHEATNADDPPVLIFSWRATRPLELWAFDDDVPQGEVGLDFDVCAATDEQEAPWATGTARVNANDNDLAVSGSRMNVFGNSGQGTVETAEGDRYHYSFLIRLQLAQDSGPFDPPTIRAGNANLKKIGN